MNATSALVLILVLSFAADRVAQAVLFVLSYLPVWRRWFPDPGLIAGKEEQARARNRHLLAYTVLVAAFAGAAIWTYPELRIIRMLSGPATESIVDIGVSLLVVMGGSELVGRIVQISGIGDAGPVGQHPGRNQPIEITGRLVLENADRPENSQSV